MQFFVLALAFVFPVFVFVLIRDMARFCLIGTVLLIIKATCHRAGMVCVRRLKLCRATHHAGKQDGNLKSRLCLSCSQTRVLSTATGRVKAHHSFLLVICSALIFSPAHKDSTVLPRSAGQMERDNASKGGTASGPEQGL